MTQTDDEDAINRDQRTCRSPIEGIKIIPGTVVGNIPTDNLHVPPVFAPIAVHVVRTSVTFSTVL